MPHKTLGDSRALTLAERKHFPAVGPVDKFAFCQDLKYDGARFFRNARPNSRQRWYGMNHGNHLAGLGTHPDKLWPIFR